MIFNKTIVKQKIDKAVSMNSELELLKVLKQNSFLFSDLYSRKWNPEPNFCEIPFGRNYRCDFCWLNNNSDGPEWVLVEIEEPQMKLFNRNQEPSADFNHAIEQVRSWDRYFKTNPMEACRIFGAVSRFRFILVVGSKNAWEERQAAIWKSHFNSTYNIEIRSMDTFYKSLERYVEDPKIISFEQHPKSLASKILSEYCNENSYIQKWKCTLTSNS